MSALYDEFTTTTGPTTTARDLTTKHQRNRTQPEADDDPFDGAVMIGAPLAVLIVIVFSLCMALLYTKARRRQAASHDNRDPMTTISGGVPMNTNAYLNYQERYQDRHQRVRSISGDDSSGQRPPQYVDGPPTYEDAMKECNTSGIINLSYAASIESNEEPPPRYASGERYSYDNRYHSNTAGSTPAPVHTSNSLPTGSPPNREQRISGDITGPGSTSQGATTSHQNNDCITNNLPSTSSDNATTSCVVSSESSRAVTSSSHRGDRHDRDSTNGRPDVLEGEPSRPAQSTSESRPTQSTSDSRPAQSTSDSRPAQGTSGSRPAQSTSGSRPAQSTSESTPAQSTSDSRPAQSTSESRPTQSTSESRPTQSTSDSRPAQSTSDSRPAQSTSDSRPAQSTSDSRPTQSTSDSEPQPLPIRQEVVVQVDSHL